ncbi:GNAT family N-acetyltransferase [Methylomonas sp. EFPC3]|uniref:GNAT family N-acetyltransferase n=1 Tax=Methylomonas sp. EFPC3 TaxID=3021710 RepID=UPI002417EB80|nr:GNAT family N-acetyltransferase [Methylomonas sp. EFPC3]WFP49668.1 GNAT family N-acetyltransferase [Methylomonas sp. EFPC3]
MQIREALISDAATLLRLFNQLDAETDFMLFEPGERQTTESEQQAIIAAFAQSERRFMYVAETVGDIIGFCVLVGNQQRRNAHTASLVIGVVKSHWRHGAGAKLLEAVIGKADTAGIERIELTVRTDNQAALALYQKFGFAIEGERIGSLNIGGNRFNEFYMARV